MHPHQSDPALQPLKHGTADTKALALDTEQLLEQAQVKINDSDFASSRLLLEEARKRRPTDSFVIQRLTLSCRPAAPASNGLAVPPLRERHQDITLLAQHFFDKFAKDRGCKLKGFSRRAMIAMAARDWPGNVRELINRVRRAMVLAEGKLILPADLGLERLNDEPAHAPLGEARLDAERHAIAESLQSAGKNVSFAARQLRISRMTLYRLMAKHGISA
jgi:hypothetical protein